MASNKIIFSIKDQILKAKSHDESLDLESINDIANRLRYLYFEYYGKVYRVLGINKTPIELAVSYQDLIAAEPVIIKINSGE